MKFYIVNNFYLCINIYITRMYLLIYDVLSSLINLYWLVCVYICIACLILLFVILCMYA